MLSKLFIIWIKFTRETAECRVDDINAYLTSTEAVRAAGECPQTWDTYDVQAVQVCYLAANVGQLLQLQYRKFVVKRIDIVSRTIFTEG